MFTNNEENTITVRTLITITLNNLAEIIMGKKGK